MLKFWLNCVFVTLFTFLVMGGLYEFTQLRIMEAFDPIGQAIGDVELSDIAFSHIREGEPKPDENITIVNVGNLKRGEIGEQIRNIARHKPKVIALDLMLNCSTLDSLTCAETFSFENNYIFHSAVREAEALGIKIVMAEKLQQTKALVEKHGDIDLYDSIEHTDPFLRLNSFEGFVNLDTDAEHQEDLKLCREVNPLIMVNGHPELAFSVRVAMMFDSLKARKFLLRGNNSEVINFRGNTPDFYGATAGSYSGRYQFLDAYQALDSASFSQDMIRDKIVIFGFHGIDLMDRSWEDKFFTPLNINYAGRSRPDMYGVVVHANAVSMILNEDYIDIMPLWLSIILSVVVTFLTAALFFKIENNIPIWYDLLSLVVQVIIFTFFSVIMLLAFSYFSLKMDFTLTLAAVALVGTCFELYNGGILRMFEYLRNRYLNRV
ncbi:MAG: CHASE2 domain-containing protein [Cyclobacteriaceae bacterium]